MQAFDRASSWGRTADHCLRRVSPAQICSRIADLLNGGHLTVNIENLRTDSGPSEFIWRLDRDTAPPDSNGFCHGVRQCLDTVGSRASTSHRAFQPRVRKSYHGTPAGESFTRHTRQSFVPRA